MTAARPYRLELYWDDTGEPLLADAARIASFVEELRTAGPQAGIEEPEQLWAYVIAAAPCPTASVYDVADTGGGRRVVAVPTWFDVNDAAHMEAVESAERGLAGFGVLRPRTRL